MNSYVLPPGERVELACLLRATLTAAEDAHSMPKKIEILKEALRVAIERIDPPLTGAQERVLKALAAGRPDVAPRGWPPVTQPHAIIAQSLERRELVTATGELTPLGRKKVVIR